VADAHVNGIRLYYEEHGSGVPILCSSNWRAMSSGERESNSPQISSVGRAMRGSRSRLVGFGHHEQLRPEALGRTSASVGIDEDQGREEPGTVAVELLDDRVAPGEAGDVRRAERERLDQHREAVRVVRPAEICRHIGGRPAPGSSQATTVNSSASAKAASCGCHMRPSTAAPSAMGSTGARYCVHEEERQLCDSPAPFRRPERAPAALASTLGRWLG
jgi:hypothetical protein